METIQLQCGNCKNMMAISTEHLGAQVQCPHCGAVLQTPPPSAPAPAPPPPLSLRESAGIPTFARPERDSIFSEPEPVDDLFGGPAPAPRVEMPRPAPSSPTPPASSMSDAFASAHDGHAQDDSAHGDSEHQMMSGAPRVASAGSNQFVSYLLIALVSYAFCSTAMITYLLMNWPSINAFDYLADPNAKGSAKQSRLQPQHDAPLPKKNLVALHDTVTIGDVSVTPTKVTLSPEGNFVLHLRIKNVASDNTHFTPINDEFLRVNDKAPTVYTYLENPIQRVYGGHLEVKRINGKDDGGELYPNEEAFFKVMTPDKVHRVVKQLADKKNETLTWRVQFRRGLVDFKGRRISATAVIGVRFTPADLERDA